MTFFMMLLVFMNVGLLSFGGGYAAVTLINQLVVTEHGWITASEFADIITIAEMTPGPIALNASTFVGVKLFGVAGGLCASLALVFPSVIFVCLLCWGYSKLKNNIFFSSSLSMLRPAVSGIIASAAFTLICTAVLTNGTLTSLSDIDITGTLLFVVAFAVLKTTKINPVTVMLATGVLRVGIEMLFQRT